MKLHNTRTRQIETFQPLDTTARIYSCGPTVYDHIHIGNLSAFIYADLLRRTIQSSGLATQHVMNFTDVDDKTIKRSREQYPDSDPHDALLNLTQHYSELFLADMDAIGNDIRAMQFVKATDSIESMRKLIEELYQDGFAYITDDGVYFSIDAYRNSGKKYGQLVEITQASTSNARIQNDEYDKESIHDFALWKLRKPDEPAWPFELNGQDLTGRPGWHIECSAMSLNTLGQPFDIHTGGIDLIFPHHENEIAQSTAGKGDTYASYFVHNEHLLVDGKKMSKSLKNFYTLEDIRKKGYDPLAFRLLVLQSHYRKPSNFSWEILDAAQNRVNKWRGMFNRRWQINVLTDDQPDISADLRSALQDDLNTTRVLALIEEYFDMVDSNGAMPNRDTLVTVRDILGVDLLDYDIDDNTKKLLKQREDARSAKDWAESDRLRDSLAKQGIIVRDVPKGQIWSRS